MTNSSMKKGSGPLHMEPINCLGAWCETVCPQLLTLVFPSGKWDGISLPDLRGRHTGHRKVPQKKGPQSPQ